MTATAPALQTILEIDRIVHEPARLAILTVLEAAEEVEFMFLMKITGFSRGNLSNHAAKLERAGYIRVKKKFRGRTPVTSYRITPKGHKALARYWKSVRAFQPRLIRDAP